MRAHRRRLSPWFALGLALVGCRTRLFDELGIDAASAAVDARVLLDAAPSDLPPFAHTCADPWPLVGHDAQHSGHGCTAGPAAPALKWISAPVPGDLSSPVVGGNGVIYTASSDGFGTSALFALSPDDGHVLWTSSLGPPPSLAYDLGPALGPGGTVYAIYQLGSVRAFSPDGAVLWTASVCDLINPWLLVGPDGAIYTGCGDSLIAALAPRDGHLLWSAHLLEPNLLALSDDGFLLVGSAATLHAFDARDGSKRWGPVRFCDTGVVGSIGPSGALFFVERWVPGCADTFIGYRLDALAAGDGSRRWHVDLPGFEYAPPSATDGTLYINSADALQAIAPDGKTRWSAGDGPTFNNAGRLVDGNGTIFAFAYRPADSLGAPGTDWLYSFTGSGKLNWKLNLGAVNLRNPPALGGNGVVYVASGSPARIFALGK